MLWSEIQLDAQRKREFFIVNLLVRTLSVIEMIWSPGLTPWESKFPFPGILISTFLAGSQPSSSLTSNHRKVINY